MADDGSLPLNFPKPETFIAVQAGDEELLNCLPDNQFRFILPSLVRMVHRNETTSTDTVIRTFFSKTLKKIISFKDVESITSLLNVNFKTVLDDITNEQQLRRKNAGFDTSNVHSENNTTPLLMEFENSNPIQRMRLVLSEVFRISAQVSFGCLFLCEGFYLFVYF